MGDERNIAGRSAVAHIEEMIAVPLLPEMLAGVARKSAQISVGAKALYHLIGRMDLFSPRPAAAAKMGALHAGVEHGFRIGPAECADRERTADVGGMHARVDC